MSIDVVWFKRDLRIRDHRPLAEACKRGPVLCLYIYEPIIFRHREFDTSRLVFTNESLAELDEALQELGGRMVYRVGEATDVLREIDETHDIARLWSHEETGSHRTYERDEAVRDWTVDRGIEWTEIPQTGVIRRLDSRDGWAERWDERMNEPTTDPPERIPAVDVDDPGHRRDHEALDIPTSTKDEAMIGGESNAEDTLETFLYERGRNYRSDMSSPVTAWDGCSRLSPHLARGTISMRRVWQATQRRKQKLREREDAGEDVDGAWFKAISSFEGRLHWHGHFMQKLEDEPRIEFENLARAYDGLREDEFDEELFEAWKAGETGFPMVDACMRALHRAGWINFRMRAMLVSFASYHLWLHWRPTGQFLAQHFLDFEPGIHWPQMQMQSGTTGINSIRIYNPTKQVRDHDPEGEFIRRYVPELEDVPSEYIADPAEMPPDVQREADCRIGFDYPAPIVDGKEAWKEANSRIWSVKNSKEAKQEADEIYERHGSRRSN
jgi:deoxyribodipyrimidine photo-lyase